MYKFDAERMREKKPKKKIEKKPIWQTNCPKYLQKSKPNWVITVGDVDVDGDNDANAKKTMFKRTSKRLH